MLTKLPFPCSNYLGEGGDVSARAHTLAPLAIGETEGGVCRNFPKCTRAHTLAASGRWVA